MAGLVVGGAFFFLPLAALRPGMAVVHSCSRQQSVKPAVLEEETGVGESDGIEGARARTAFQHRVLVVRRMLDGRRGQVWLSAM